MEDFQLQSNWSGNLSLETLPIPENFDCSKILEDSQMVILNSPLVIYTPSTSQDCPLLLNSIEDVNVFAQNLSGFVLDPNHFDSKQEGTSNNIYDFTKSIDFDIEDKPKATVDFTNIEPDRPEFIDITKLSEISLNPTDGNKTEISDDEVIFVKEYKKSEDVDEGPGENIESNEKTCIKTDQKENGNCNNIRRNPVRTVRNKSKAVSKELLYEEDFAFLDMTDDEIDIKDNKTEKKQPAVKLPKEWPINVHERPEYNAVTKEIEYFDYTIREIQEKAVTVKKHKPEPSRSLKRSKKKPVSRRKQKPTVPSVPKETASLETLKPLINITTEMLKKYFIDCKKYKDILPPPSPLSTFENKLEILKNQAFLFAIVNNLDEREVINKFKHINLENEAKD